MSKKNKRFPGLKRDSLKPLDSNFSSGKPTKAEQKEWADWHGGYKEADVFQSYLGRIRSIPNDGSLEAHLKMVPPIAYELAPQYGHRPSKGVLRDAKLALQGYRHIIEDLIGSGNEGLLHGARRFRPNAGAQFSTAARYSIAKEIRAQAKWLRSAVRTPERKDTPWSQSLSIFDDDANEYGGQVDVSSSGFAQSAYQLRDDAADADHAGPTIQTGAYDYSDDEATRANLPPWLGHAEWLDALHDIRTGGRLARIWEPDYKPLGPPLPLATANRLALWRLAEHERQDHEPRPLTSCEPEVKERWRKRKGIPDLWEPLVMFWNPPKEAWPVRSLDRETKLPWKRSELPWSMRMAQEWPYLIKYKYRGRSAWRTPLKPDDWRLARAQQRRELLMPEVEWNPRELIWKKENRNAPNQKTRNRRAQSG
jgi:hypothetical protein